MVTFQRNNVNLSKQNPIDTQNVAVNVAEKLTERQLIIIEMIEKGVAQNVAVDTKYLSEKLNVNKKNYSERYGISAREETYTMGWSRQRWSLGNYKT